MDSENQSNVENVGEISEPLIENTNKSSGDTNEEQSDTIDIIGNGQLIKKVFILTII